MVRIKIKEQEGTTFNLSKEIKSLGRFTILNFNTVYIRQSTTNSKVLR